MKYRVEVSARAEHDLHEIVTYLSEREPAAAEAWLDAFERAVASLASYPRRCRPLPEVSDLLADVRQVLVGPYRVIFAIEPAASTPPRGVGRVVVLHVRHAARSGLGPV